MNSDQLFINDIEIELDGKSVIALSSQINRMEDLTDHQSNLTNKVKVPKSKSNIAALENSDRVDSSTLMPYLKNKARLYKLGVEVIQNGYAIIDSTDSFFYITVYSGNVSFFDVIEKLKISDLSLSAFNHLLSFANIEASAIYTSTSGYKYSIINYGQLDNSVRTIDPTDLRVCAFVPMLFKKIIEEALFILDSPFIATSAEFDKLLITTDNDNKGGNYFDTLNRIDEYALPWIVTFAPDYNPAAASGSWSFIKLLAGERWDYSFRVVWTESLWTAVTSRFRIVSILDPLRGASVGTFLGTLYNHTDASGSGSFDQTVTGYLHNTSSVDSYFYVGVEITSGRANIHYSDIKGTKLGSLSEDFNMHAHDTGIFQTGPASPAYYRILPAWNRLDQYNYTTVNIANKLPDISQKDFIKAISQMFGFIFKSSATKRKIYIRRFQDIIDNILIAKDWTEKLHTKNSSLDFRISNYAQKNNCKYLPDDKDTLLPKYYGDGIIYVNDETLATEKDAIKLPFAATAMEKRMIDIDIPHVQRINDDTGAWDIENVPRILVDDLTDFTGSAAGDILYDDGVDVSIITTTVPLCYFKLESKTFNLGFDDSLLEDNYSSLTNILNKSKRVSGMFNLTAPDVYQFTEGDPDTEGHFIPIFLKQHSAYFYVSKIINFTGKGLTKVELIRIGAKNRGLIGKTTRCSFDYTDNYGVINRSWVTTTHSFTIVSILLNGIEYGNAENLLVVAPGDLVAGLGLDGVTSFIMNLSDWLNTLLPDGWTVYDDMMSIDMPSGSVFEIIIDYDDFSFPGQSAQYTYNNEGLSLPGDSLAIYKTCTEL